MSRPSGTTSGSLEAAIEDVDDFWGVPEDDGYPYELPPLPPDPLGPDPFGTQSAADRLAGHGESPERDIVAGEALATVAPGPSLAALLESIDSTDVSLYFLVEMIAAYQRLGAWAQARLVELAGQLTSRPGINPHHPLPGGSYAIEAAASEIAPRLGMSRYTARRLVANAGAFRHKLDQTAEALRLGSIDYAKATTLARLLNDQPADVAWEVQRRVLPDAGQQTLTELSRAVEKAIIAIDPHRATQRHRRARDQRRVDHPRHEPDGMASVYALLPATDAAGLDLALEAAARSAKANGDKRTIDQLRADALALMGHTALDEGYIGKREDVPTTQHGSEPQHDDAERPDDVSTDAPDSPDNEDQPAATPDPSDHDDAASGEPHRPDDAPGEAPRVPVAYDIASPDVPRSPDRDDAAPPAPPPPVADSGSDLPEGQPVSDYLRMLRMPVGTIGGRRAQILVTVPLSVLVLPPESQGGMGSLGECLPHLTGEIEPPGPSSAHEQGPDPDDGPELAEVAELEGYGPITPDVARALAMSGGTWRRLVTDPLSGELLDLGRTRYRPPAALAEFVRHRDRTCVHPNCTTPAHACQLDHIEPWYPDGTTSAFNLALECTPHHIAKTVGDLTLRRLPGGTLEWTTASGHMYHRDHRGRITRVIRSGGATAETGPPF